MPRELFQSPALARAFGNTTSPSLAIRKRHRSDPPVPPWCKLTPAVVWQGQGGILYEHAIDMYCLLHRIRGNGRKSINATGPYSRAFPFSLILERVR